MANVVSVDLNRTAGYIKRNCSIQTGNNIGSEYSWRRKLKQNSLFFYDKYINAFEENLMNIKYLVR